MFYLIDITLNNLYIIYKHSNKYHSNNHTNLLLYFHKTLLDEIFTYYNNKITIIKQNINTNNHHHEYIRIYYNNKYITCDNCKKIRIREAKEIIQEPNIDAIPAI